MKHRYRRWLCATLGLAATLALSLQASAFEGEITSTKDQGVVSIVPDPGLSGGRLVIKIVAQNKGAAPVVFSNSNIQITTAAGKAVAIVPLEQLIKEVTAAAKPQRRNDSALQTHQQADYSHDDNAALRDTSGTVVGGNYGGAAAVAAPITSSQATAAGSGKLDAQTQQQVDSLKAGILQSLTLAPGQANGAQIVTERLKFTGKEPRALKLLVQLNGEQHEFNISVPPEL